MLGFKFNHVSKRFSGLAQFIYPASMEVSDEFKKDLELFSAKSNLSLYDSDPLLNIIKHKFVGNRLFSYSRN